MKSPLPFSDFCSPILLGSQITHLHFCIPLTFLKNLYSIPASFVATKNADVSILSTCAMPLRYENIMLQNSVLQSITPFKISSHMLS